jgi:hypothetical protein
MNLKRLSSRALRHSGIIQEPFELSASHFVKARSAARASA